MKTIALALLFCSVACTHCMEPSKTAKKKEISQVSQTDDKEKKEISEKEVQLCVQYSENNSIHASLIKVNQSATYNEVEKIVAEKTNKRSGSFSLMVPKSTPEILSPKNFTVSKLELPKSDEHQDMRTFMRIIITNHTNATSNTNNQK